MKRERATAFVAQATKFSARSLEISGKRLVHSEYVYMRAIFIYPTRFSHPGTRSPRHAVIVIVVVSLADETALFQDYNNFLHNIADKSRGTFPASARVLRESFLRNAIVLSALQQKC